MQIKLNKRLETVASLVEDKCRFIDIGCDHAFLTIYLVQTKSIPKAIASDIKEGPINQAKENIDKYKLNDIIKIKQGNGVETIEDDINTIIISGMGGLNIIGILKYKKYLYKNVDTIILSPNTDVDFVRVEMNKLGYYIEDEKIVKENNQIYVVIKFKKGKKRYKKIEYLLGPILLEKKDDLFIEYLNNIINTKTKILEILPKKYISKRITLKKELIQLKKIV